MIPLFRAERIISFRYSSAHGQAEPRAAGRLPLADNDRRLLARSLVGIILAVIFLLCPGYSSSLSLLLSFSPSLTFHSSRYYSPRAAFGLGFQRSRGTDSGVSLLDEGCEHFL